MLVIVPLSAVVDVVKHDNAGDEEHCLARWKEVQVVPAVAAPVTIAGRAGSRRHLCQSWCITSTIHPTMETRSLSTIRMSTSDFG